MTDDMKFRCVALDQVVDHDSIRRDMVKAYFGGMIPGEPLNPNDTQNNGEAAE